MRRFWAIPLLALGACDVAPRPVDLERSFVETPQEGYQLVLDTLTARVVADRAAENCALFTVDEDRKNEHNAFLQSEFDRLARERPEVFDATMRRIGLPDRASDWTSRDQIGLPKSHGGQLRLYQASNPGVTLDAGSRMTGVILRQQFLPGCKAAEREVEGKTLAGTFLKRVPAVPLVAQTSTQTEKPSERMAMPSPLIE